MELRELLNKIDSDLAAAKPKEYLQAQRFLLFREFLVPQNFQVLPIVVDQYEPEAYTVGMMPPDTYTVIIHGHPVGIPCYASNYCHVMGYRPSGSEHPSFIKLFNQKWKVQK